MCIPLHVIVVHDDAAAARGPSLNKWKLGVESGTTSTPIHKSARAPCYGPRDPFHCVVESQTHTRALLYGTLWPTRDRVFPSSNPRCGAANRRFKWQGLRNHSKESSGENERHLEETQCTLSHQAKKRWWLVRSYQLYSHSGLSSISVLPPVFCHWDIAAGRLHHTTASPPSPTYDVQYIRCFT